MHKIIKETFDKDGELHSYNDEPAVIWSDETKEWCKHGEFHRENGPSIINKDGTFSWYYKNQIHVDTKNKPINNTILIKYIYDVDIIYNNKIAIILKQMTKYDSNVYLCLIDNDKIYVKVH